MSRPQVGVDQGHVAPGDVERTRAVAKDPLQRQDVAAEGQIAGREGVPEGVGRAADAADAGPKAQLADSLVDRPITDRPAAALHEDGAALLAAPGLDVAP